MEKTSVAKQFSVRLREAMIAAGFDSSRSISGVSVHDLATMTGYSVQICRRYLRGEAIPEPGKLIEIAEKLAVTPGWLLFGDSNLDINKAHSLTINKPMLHYFLTKIAFLYTNKNSIDDIADFLVALLASISQIHANDAQLKKIIDLALSSAKHFNY
jgi:transcriptional regulator with XRE-family HTH domain